MLPLTSSTRPAGGCSFSLLPSHQDLGSTVCSPCLYFLNLHSLLSLLRAGFIAYPTTSLKLPRWPVNDTRALVIRYRWPREGLCLWTRCLSLVKTTPKEANNWGSQSLFLKGRMSLPVFVCAQNFAFQKKDKGFLKNMSRQRENGRAQSGEPDEVRIKSDGVRNAYQFLDLNRGFGFGIPRDKSKMT